MKPYRFRLSDHAIAVGMAETTDHNDGRRITVGLRNQLVTANRTLKDGRVSISAECYPFDLFIARSQLVPVRVVVTRVDANPTNEFTRDPY